MTQRTPKQCCNERQSSATPNGSAATHGLIAIAWPATMRSRKTTLQRNVTHRYKHVEQLRQSSPLLRVHRGIAQAMARQLMVSWLLPSQQPLTSLCHRHHLTRRNRRRCMLCPTAQATHLGTSCAGACSVRARSWACRSRPALCPAPCPAQRHGVARLSGKRLLGKRLSGSDARLGYMARL